MDPTQRFDGTVVATVVMEVAAQVSALRANGEVRLLTTGPEGPTTNADVTAQALLMDRLVSLFGPAEIVAEEGTYRGIGVVSRFAPLTWIIDPLDGTSGYLSGRATYGVQLAAYGDGKLLGGWISCPDLGWHVTAWEGGALTVDGIDGYDVPHRLLIADGDFDTPHLEAMALRGVSTYARSSSCAVDYALLAAGLLDTAMYRRTHPWDHAPGSYIVRRAGGRSMRWNGAVYDPGVADEGILSVANGVDVDTARARLLR
ncbi:MAG TPA: inositol monophosphatase family protein [Streptosporangiaceae bacterium]|nr:inositol monophosphatase family protein [Streptosporangiaceae bacterium]